MSDTGQQLAVTSPPTSPPAGAEAAGDFVISLIQAFLRTGYYLSDHPETKKAKAGLHTRFSALTRTSGEIGFVLKEEEGGPFVTVEGIADNSLRLADMMLRGMADTYNPRFVQFLARKELVSLNLSTRMESEEFSQLIDVMSEPALSDLKERAVKDQFEAGLKERGVVNVSFIFREEFVTSRAGVPWRAALALSRLKKDILGLPALLGKGEEDLTRRLKHLFPDILRPLGEPSLIYALLMNLDVATSPDLTEEEAEERVFATVSEQILTEVVREFLDDVSRRKEVFFQQLTAEKKGRVAYHVYSRLTGSDDPENVAFLEEMAGLGLLAPEKLPQKSRDRIRTLQMATAFMKDAERYLRNLHAASLVGDYEPMARSFARIFPVLTEKGQWEQAAGIAEAFASHAREAGDRAGIASAALAWLKKGPSLEAAGDAFLRSGKEERAGLARLFIAFGGDSFPQLLRIFAGTGDVWRCKAAGDILVRLGPGALTALIAAVDAGKIPAGAMSAAIRTLSQATEAGLRREAIRVVEAKLAAKDEELRREALSALCRLDAPNQVRLFLTRLKAGDTREKKIALRGLGLSGAPEALVELKTVIARGENPSHDEEGELAAAAIEVLGICCEVNPTVREEVVRYVLELGGRAEPGARWKAVLGKRSNLPSYALVALAELLNKVGGEAGRRCLEKLSSHRHPAVARKADEILKRRSEA